MSHRPATGSVAGRCISPRRREVGGALGLSAFTRRPLRRDWEGDLEGGAATHRGIHPDRSPEHFLRDLTDDRQSRPRARAELLGRETRLEDPLQMLRRDSHPVVLDRQAERLADLHQADYDR